MKRHHAVTILVIGLGLMAYGHQVPDRVHAASEVFTTPIGSALAACELKCEHTGCDPNQHDAWEGSPKEWQKKGGAHLSAPFCKAGTCFTAHGNGESNDCTIVEAPEALTNAAFNGLRASAVSKDAAGVVRMLKDHPAQVTLNVSRSALQVRNCRGLLVAHLPIGAPLLQAVQEATTTVN